MSGMGDSPCAPVLEPAFGDRGHTVIVLLAEQLLLEPIGRGCTPGRSTGTALSNKIATVYPCQPMGQCWHSSGRWVTRPTSGADSRTAKLKQKARPAAMLALATYLQQTGGPECTAQTVPGLCRSQQENDCGGGAGSSLVLPCACLLFETIGAGQSFPCACLCSPLCACLTPARLAPCHPGGRSLLSACVTGRTYKHFEPNLHPIAMHWARMHAHQGRKPHKQ